MGSVVGKASWHGKLGRLGGKLESRSKQKKREYNTQRRKMIQKSPALEPGLFDFDILILFHQKHFAGFTVASAFYRIEIDPT